MSVRSAVEMDNVADMRRTAPRSGLYVTRGFRSPGDGGQGWYRYSRDCSGGRQHLLHIEHPGGGCFELLHDGSINVRQFGARGDGSSDDSPAFNAFARALNALDELAGHVPACASFYRLTRPFIILRDVVLTGEGQRSHIRNTNLGRGFSWLNSCILIGTYFGFELRDSVHAEPSSDLLEMEVGAREVTLAAGDARRFAAGDVVFIESQARVGSTRYHVHAHCNEVVAVPTAHSLLLKYPVRDRYASGATIRTETGSVALPTSLAGIQGEYHCRLARHSHLRNLAFSTAESQAGHAQCIHVSSWECRLEDIQVIDSADAMGINPCGRTQFRNLDLRYRGKGFECAYLSNDLIVDGYTGTRIGHPTTGNLDFPMVFSETGQDISVSNFLISDYHWPGDRGVSAISVLNRRVHLHYGHIQGSQGGGVAFIGDDRASGSTARHVHLVGHTANGIDVDCNDIALTDCTIGPTQPGQVAVDVSARVERITVRSLALGDHSRPTWADRIRCVRPGLDISGVQSVLSGSSSTDLSRYESNALEPQLVRALQVPPARSSERANWRISASGTSSLRYTPGRLTLRCGGVDVVVLECAPADNTIWWLDATVGKLSDDRQYVSCTGWSAASGAVGHACNTNVDMRLRGYWITLLLQVGHPADAMIVNEWRVAALNDQCDIVPA